MNIIVTAFVLFAAVFISAMVLSVLISLKARKKKENNNGRKS